jgi:small subunit ribosomal protein S16
MPLYQIVAADSRAARTGKFLEIVGRYEPMQNPPLITTREERLFYWLRKGALPTTTVRSLLRRSGAWFKWSLTKKGKDEGTIAKEMEKWQMLQAAKQEHKREKRSRRVAKEKPPKVVEAAEPAATAETPAQ